MRLLLPIVLIRIRWIVITIIIIIPTRPKDIESSIIFIKLQNFHCYTEDKNSKVAVHYYSTVVVN